MKQTLTLAAALMALAAPVFAEGDAATGEKEFRKCKSCHMIASADEAIVKGGKTGPNLYGVIGRTAGTAEDFSYGDDLKAAGDAGLVWDEASLAAYIEDPKAFLQETLDDKGAKSKMTFKMRKNAGDVAAYLATFSE
ncbi:cytochrome c [Pseudooceanicola nitratireducens]|jgi:cytochrome c|uniref:Cytochrome c n=1 Tax=Pseudooceanicola nitratireducens TaxID=517719 RepID=A0A1I1K6V0_9RHOB|nr:cytochrome C [Pseudooceanicola nitratireducens]SEJ48479.1 cytochrome c [Pseudooceanicola nitratireducens]SFC56241.1 cytochrome c [Pseudooceanicola nitratireducens]